MCGICGKLNFDRLEPANADLLRRMTESMFHRGPDGSGEYLSGPVALGHRRLSIIDLNTGAQPMSNEDGTVWVVYNGEIYNFQELRSDLKRRGHRFKSTSDTEVIVHLYEELGDECVSRFRGMFAFALWDDRRQRLLLARDRVGIKPLYYAETRGGLIFASEIKAILEDPELERRVSLSAIDRFLTYYYLPGNDTLLEGIQKLAPGHYLTVERGKVSIRRYWDLHFDATCCKAGFREAVEALQNLLRRTVKDHMISDVPVGVLLSGGVDSTGVLSYAAEHSGQPIHTFTMGFDGADFDDERPYARLAARRLGTVHHETSITAKDFRDFLPKYVWHMEEPVCEPPAIALYHVSRLAREMSVKVLLSGEGGDEAFGGYQTYRNHLLLEGLKSAFGSAKRVLRVGLEALGQAGWTQVGNYARLVDVPFQDYYFSRTATPFTPFNLLRPAIYSSQFASAFTQDRPNALIRELLKNVRGQSLLNRMLYLDTKTWLPDDLLVKADKMTMATSVELRVPLLDFQVLEFAASLPERYKVSGWRLKRILKAALARSIPREIIRRKKTGFPVPYATWMRRELRDFVRETLLASNAAWRAYLRQEPVEQLLDSHDQGQNVSKEVFSLLVLELWHREFTGPSGLQHRHSVRQK